MPRHRVPPLTVRSSRGEFGLIHRIAGLAAGTRSSDVALGIGDDAAVLDLPRGSQLVAAVDTLVAGVHFPLATLPAAVGWKALAVNVSDLAAMGAQPRWALLSITVPEPPAALALTRGVLACARRYGIALVGGDTTRGPLSVSVTLLGSVPRGRAVTRAGAQAGDDIWVVGVLGDAAAGLACVEGRLKANARDRASLVRALDRPQPPLAFGLALRGVASAMIDVSDGVHADLSHVLRASRLGATVDPVLLPESAVLRRVVSDPSEREEMQCRGDDYTLLFTAPSRHARKITAIAQHLGVRVNKIGATHQREGLWRAVTGKAPIRIAARGFDHFVD